MTSKVDDKVYHFCPEHKAAPVPDTFKCGDRARQAQQWVAEV
ncbi:hypothetical protein AB0F17_16105 [Nonomuraea sp. NPDC026600]